MPWSCGFAHQKFDILLHWIMRLGLIVYSCLFNLKLDFVRYVMSFRTLKVIRWCYNWFLCDVICIDIINTWISVTLKHAVLLWMLGIYKNCYNGLVLLVGTQKKFLRLATSFLKWCVMLSNECILFVVVYYNALVVLWSFGSFVCLFGILWE